MTRQTVASLLALSMLTACGTHTSGGDNPSPTSTPSNPVVSATASTTSGFAPIQVQFSATATGGQGALQYAWDFGDNTQAATQSPTHTYIANGNYNATVTVTDEQFDTTTATVTIVVGKRVAPAVTATVNQSTGLAPLGVTFTSTITGGVAPITTSWDFGDGQTAATQNPAHSYITPGSYGATITVKDSTGASAAATVLIQVGNTVQPVVAISANPPSGAAPLPVAFASQAAGGNGTLAYAWDFGDGTTDVTASPSHQYAAAGTYTARLTVTDSKNTSATTTLTILVSNAASPAPSLPQLVVSDFDSYQTSNSDGYTPNSDIDEAYFLGASGTYTISDAYLFPVNLTYYADVSNIGASTTTPFFVDFYQNMSSAPGAGVYGDQFQQVQGLAANASTRLYFTVANAYPAGASVAAASTTSWIKADSSGDVTQSDTSLNVDSDSATVIPDEGWFSVSETAGQTLQISLTNLPADYDLELYDPNGTKVASSANSGTANESITFTTTLDGTWSIRVYGYLGANSATQPYTLSVIVP